MRGSLKVKYLELFCQFFIDILCCFSSRNDRMKNRMKLRLPSDKLECYDEAKIRLERELDCENLINKMRVIQGALDLLLTPEQ